MLSFYVIELGHGHGIGECYFKALLCNTPLSYTPPLVVFAILKPLVNPYLRILNFTHTVQNIFFPLIKKSSYNIEVFGIEIG